MNEEHVKNIIKDTIIYDGDCRFCTSQIGILRRLDWGKRLGFISLHEPSVSVRFPDLSYEQMMEQMWVISTDGKRFGGADAVRYLSRKLPSLYLLAPVLHFPGTMPIWRACYRWIARWRYRIAGRNCSEGTCKLH